MTHIDDWLDDPATATNETMVLVKEWLTEIVKILCEKI